MISRVDHIDIKVENPEKLIETFSAMGMTIIRSMPERDSVEMAFAGENQVVFEIHRSKEGGPHGIHHIAFKSDDEKDVDMLKQVVGADFTSEHMLIKHTGRTVSTFKDDAGLTWQLTD